MSPVHDPRFTDAHRQSLLEGAREEAELGHRWSYYTPLIMLGGGLLVSAGIATMSAGGIIAGVISIPINLIAIGMLSIVGIGVMLIVCALFQSDAGNLWLALLRLAGIYAVVMPIMTIFAPLACFAYIIGGLSLAILIAVIFDMEVVDGIVFAVLNLFMLVGALIVLAALLG